MNTAPKLSEAIETLRKYRNNGSVRIWDMDAALDVVLAALAPPSGEGVVVPRKLLEAVIARDGGNACNCIYHSRKAEREYENSHCPHQQLAAMLAKAEAK